MIFIKRYHRTTNRNMRDTRALITFSALVLLTFFTLELSTAQVPTRTKLSVGPRGAKLTIQQLATSSEMVAVGTIAGLQSEWNNNKTRIITRATLRVDEYVKGNPGQNTITLVYPGGEVGGEGELYSHTVTFQKNEEVMIFAGKDREGNFRITGGDQGKMRITKDNTTGKKMVSSTISIDEMKIQVKGFLKIQDNK